MYKGTLPHWRMDASTYFVTWRLAASQVPLRGEEKTLVADAIIHFSGVRYDVVAYVIMDDHVHVLVTPAKGFFCRELSTTGSHLQPIVSKGISQDSGRFGKENILIELSETSMS